MTTKIPFAKPNLGEEEIAEVVDTLRSGWLTTGPKTKRFEEDFARYTGVAHALGTSSCTGALHLALASLGITDGDEVLTSTMTFAATANVIVHCGARPVFADVAPHSMSVDVADLERRITDKTKAIVAVHYAGRPCEIVALRAIADRRGLKLVEDAAHAVGARIGDRGAGAWGDAAGFSFYANKNLTTGEGGMLTTPHADVVARARVLRLQGMTRDVFRRGEASALPSWRYEIVAAGFKYPMSDIQAAIGIHQLNRMEASQLARRRIAARYSAELAGVPGLTIAQPEAEGTVHAWHLYVVRIAPGARLTRDELFTALAARQIECSVHFVPLHLQPYYQQAWGYAAGDFPRAEAAFEEILSLPLYPTMTDGEQTRVIESIVELLR